MHSNMLRDERYRGRRSSSRLSISLNQLTALEPHKGVPGPRWAFPSGSSPNGHGGASGGPDGQPIEPTVPVRTDTIPTGSVPAVRTTTEQTVGLTAQQREEIIKMLAMGAGRGAACEQIGITMRRLFQSLVADPGFRDRVETAEDARINDCELILYDQAMNGSLAAAIAFIKLKRDHKINEARLKNDTKIVDAYASQSTVNLSLLDDDQFKRFCVLHGRIEAGEALATDEAAEYCKLMAVVARPASGTGPMSLAETERLFGVDDNEAG